MPQGRQISIKLLQRFSLSLSYCPAHPYTGDTDGGWRQGVHIEERLRIRFGLIFEEEKNPDPTLKKEIRIRPYKNDKNIPS